MSSPKGNGTTYEFPYQKPETRTKWQQVKEGIYNPSTHEVLGRTCSSWGGLLIFYSIFYCILAAFFAICMKGMLHTIDDKEPYFKQDWSLIGTSPGLGFRPISPDVEKEGSLIWYQAKNASNVKTWVDRAEDFLHPYKNRTALKGGGLNQVQCDYNNLPRGDQVCAMNMDLWGRCTERFGYGYNQSSPCVFVKLNKIFDWVPEFYNDTQNLPEEMPESLKGFIRTRAPRELNTVWVSCEGENPSDKENIGPIVMFPTRGIPGFYFPYKNQPGYLSPVVAIWFERPTPGVLINVECRAWAKNINYRRHTTLREGSVHFELMID